MRKILILFLFISNFCNSQNPSPSDLVHLPEFFDDAVFFCDKFITPATDAAVYQSASCWIYSAKKNKLWSTSIGINGNVFFVPNADRNFVLNNSDFKFLKLMNGESATVQTALGNDEFVRIIDKYGIIDVMKPIKTPKGVNSNTIIYPHLSGSVTIWGGTELIGKYAPKTAIKTGEYAVYGFGVKHNVSQYLPNLEKKNINISMALTRSFENISFDFLDFPVNLGTTFGYKTLGISRIDGKVKTWQMQTNVSKEYGNFEIMIGSMVNISDFKYEFAGDKGTIDEVFPFEGGSSQAFFNEKLKSIYKTKINSIYEVSATYKLRNMYFQSAVAFNEFVNANVSVYYKFF
jgi:hypothetical protein